MSGIRERVAAYRWYHTIELPENVVTPGRFDTREAARKIPLPASLEGKRCLDVGTSDGFWAFEMERRGAREVVAVDLADPWHHELEANDWDPSDESSRQTKTFALARELLGSKVQWRNLSVYDLDPDDIGTFDFVFMGSLLLHLRDPLLALSRVRAVTQGQFLSYDTISPLLTIVHPVMPAVRFQRGVMTQWWVPNKAAQRSMIETAGFEIERAGGVVWVRRPIRLRGRVVLRHPFVMVMLRLAGVPQSWVLARPAADGDGVASRR